MARASKPRARCEASVTAPPQNPSAKWERAAEAGRLVGGQGSFLCDVSCLPVQLLPRAPF